jgi:3-hydroxyacyl-CoA dehydrogenase
MIKLVQVETAEGVATVTLENPPLNVLTRGLLTALDACLTDVLSDATVQVVVLRAAGRSWPVGADIAELGEAPRKGAPDLRTVCARLRASPKPVIATLHGHALGGGMELALAADYRLAAPGTSCGFPEISLGLVPGAGATQVVPRLCGAKAALGLMLTGLPVAAERAVQMGLIDAVVEGGLDAGVRALAADMAQTVASGQGNLPRKRDPRAGLAEPDAFMAAVAEARAGLKEQRLPAPGRLIECVEAALLLPEAAGLELEETAFQDLLASPESQALRHAFFAERRAARHPDLAGVPAKPLTHAGVIGAGEAASELCSALLATGLRVTMHAGQAADLSEGLARVAAAHERALARGQITAEAREAEWDRIGGTTDPLGLVGCELVILSPGAGQDGGALLALSEVAAPEAIVARPLIVGAEDAALPYSEITQPVIGLHLSRQPAGARLLEVSFGADVPRGAMAAIVGLARRMGRHLLVLPDDAEPPSRALARTLQGAMDALVAEGASPYAIDRALKGYGFVTGPYRLMDEIGLDQPSGEVSRATARLIAAGRTGRAAGAGYYLHDSDTGLAREDGAALALIGAARARNGLSTRKVSADEIVVAALAVLANAGARMVEDGIARRPSDVDLAAIHGLGFPRWRGGPMHAADQAGLLQLRNFLQDKAEGATGANPVWAPAAIWDELIKYGRRFESLDRI